MPEAVVTFDLDFLPAKFREQKGNRRAHIWRAAVIALVGGTLLIVCAGQFVLKFHAKSELAELQPRRVAAEQQTRKLADLQQKLKVSTAQADLYVYLRHPWPRTNLVSAVLAPLPDRATIEELRIMHDIGERTVISESARPRGKDDAAEKNAPPALRDLRRLREEYDKQTTIVAVSGIARDHESISEYLQALRSCELFTKLDLGPTESGDEKRAGIKFSLRLGVRPGYDQPGGPTAPPVAGRGDSE